MAATPGKGTTITIGGTLIGQVVSISGPNRSFGTVECTHLTSNCKEYIKTIGDNGEITFTINLDYSDASHTALETAYASKEASEFVVTHPSPESKTETFSAYVTGLGKSGMEVEGVVQREVTTKLNSNIVIA